MLAATFDGQEVTTMSDLLRQAFVDAFGRAGRHAALPIANLDDGRWALRFVSRQAPRLVNPTGQRLIVEPGRGSVLQIFADLRPMISSLGIIPIMQQIRVLEFIAAAADP